MPQLQPSLRQRPPHVAVTWGQIQCACQLFLDPITNLCGHSVCGCPHPFVCLNEASVCARAWGDAIYESQHNLIFRTRSGLLAELPRLHPSQSHENWEGCLAHCVSDFGVAIRIQARCSLSSQHCVCSHSAVDEVLPSLSNQATEALVQCAGLQRLLEPVSMSPCGTSSPTCPGLRFHLFSASV